MKETSKDAKVLVDRLHRVLSQWKYEADSLSNGTHPHCAMISKQQALHEECAIRGCIVDINDLVFGADYGAIARE